MYYSSLIWDSETDLHNALSRSSSSPNYLKQTKKKVIFGLKHLRIIDPGLYDYIVYIHTYQPNSLMGSNSQFVKHMNALIYGSSKLL